MQLATGSTGIAPLNALYEYFIVAYPDSLVQYRIREETQIFQDRFGLGQPADAKAFLLIANYFAKEVMEETLIRWLENIARLKNSFTATLNNFSASPPGTIYLKVQEPAPFIQLANSIKMIDSFVQANDCPPVQLIKRPMITIASGLPEHLYETAVHEYDGRIFNASFIIEKLALIKRESHNDPFQLVYSFSLSNQY
jgi:hypothetical protein